MESESARYIISAATIKTDDGIYKCVAKIRKVASDLSNEIVVACKSVSSR